VKTPEQIADAMVEIITGHDKNGNLTEYGHAMLKDRGLIKTVTVDHYLGPVMSRRAGRADKSKKRKMT